MRWPRSCAMRPHDRLLARRRTIILRCSDFINKRALWRRLPRMRLVRRNPTTGRVPIEVEHIDGDWQNNHLSNLTLLCPNCHALTPTFRGLNRGRGRAHRLGRLERKVTEAAILEESQSQLELLMPT